MIKKTTANNKLIKYSEPSNRNTTKDMYTYIRMPFKWTHLCAYVVFNSLSQICNNFLQLIYSMSVCWLISKKSNLLNIDIYGIISSFTPWICTKKILLVLYYSQSTTCATPIMPRAWGFTIRDLLRLHLTSTFDNVYNNPLINEWANFCINDQQYVAFYDKFDHSVMFKFAD